MGGGASSFSGAEREDKKACSGPPGRDGRGFQGTCPVGGGGDGEGEGRSGEYSVELFCILGGIRKQACWELQFIL